MKHTINDVTVTQTTSIQSMGLVEGRNYICYSSSRKEQGNSYFKIAQFVMNIVREPHFVTTCFDSDISELNLVIDPDYIPENLWMPIGLVSLKDDQPLLYTYRMNPGIVYAGTYHDSKSSGYYQGSNCPNIAGTPIPKFDKVITLEQLLNWDRWMCGQSKHAVA